MAEEFATRLKRELEEIRRSEYGHDWPLSQAIAVIEAQQAEIDRLRAAGDALAEAALNDLPSNWVVWNVAAWQEARRV